MAKKIVAVNAGPRKGGKTDTLISEAKKQRPAPVFPKEGEKALKMGANLVR